MNYNYENFEKIKFKNYTIDDIRNRKTLETLNSFIREVASIATQKNLKYFISGSLLASLLTNKIYRTWKDIDIIIEKDKIIDWQNLFSKDQWLCVFYEVDDNKNNIENRISFIHKQYGSKIDIISKNLQHYENDKIICEKHLILSFLWKKTVGLRNVDKDDYIFYNQFLNTKITDYEFSKNFKNNFLGIIN